jgi:hypothetical protein
MSRDHLLHEAFTRELDAVPVPPPERWVPGAKRGVRVPTFVLIAMVGVTALALVAGSAVREFRMMRESAVGGSGPAATPTVAPATAPVTFPPAYPTFIGDQGFAPLPRLAQNTSVPYNLLLPAWFRHSEAEEIAPRPAGLQTIEVFTARTREEEARFLGRDPVPWDLVVETWTRGSRTAEDWARSTYRCAQTCSLSQTRINGVAALVATMPGHKVYLIERGDRLIVLRYAVGTEAERPRETSEATLDRIINSLGLP